MRKLFFMLIIATFLLATMFSARAIAQGKEDLVDSAYGTVVSVSEGFVTINEYNFDLDTEKSMVYEITSETELENTDSLENVKPESEVSLEYIVQDGKNKVVSIYLYGEGE